MTKSQLRGEINSRLGPVLTRARVRSGSSIAAAAQSLGLSEPELSDIETRPGEIPCCRLYEVIELYGSEARWETQEALLDIQRLGSEYRAQRGWLEKVRSWLAVEIHRSWRIILAVFAVRILLDLWRTYG